jgi:hypothetical protein
MLHSREEDARGQVAPAPEPAGRRGRALRPNRVEPDELSDLDRHVLEEAFRQARRLQSRLAPDYELGGA